MTVSAYEDGLLDSTDGVAVLDGVSATTLPAEIRTLAERYEHTIGERDPFFWKWMYASMQPIRLSCVPERHHEQVGVLKTMCGMFDTVVDDLVDRVGDPRCLSVVGRIPFEDVDAEAVSLPGDVEARAHIEFAQSLWDELEAGLQSAPQAERYRPHFEFDVEQVLHSMKHSLLVADDPAMTNMAEGVGYQSHTLIHYLNADVDLMFSPAFDRADLGPLRRLLWNGQQLHRLINWVTTWERELAEGDFSSGVFSLALEQGLLDVGDLVDVREGRADAAAVRALVEEHDLEAQLLERWDRQYRETLDTARTASTSSVDLPAYVLGVREVCQNCLAAKGNLL